MGSLDELREVKEVPVSVRVLEEHPCVLARGEVSLSHISHVHRETERVCSRLHHAECLRVHVVRHQQPVALVVSEERKQALSAKAQGGDY